MTAEDDPRDHPDARGDLIPTDEIEALVDQRVEERLAELGVNEENASSISRRSLLGALGGGAAGFGLASVGEASSTTKSQRAIDNSRVSDFEVPNLSAQTVRTEFLQAGTANVRELNGVRYASEYKGTNGGEMIQNAIDEAHNSSGRNTIVVGPNGPDDGIWEVDTIVLYPNTTLYLVNTYIKIADGFTGPIIRNSNLESISRNIHICGIGDSFLDGNPSGSKRAGTGTIQDTGIKLVGVRNWSIQNLRIRSNAWGVAPENVEDGYIHNITFEQNGVTKHQDGVHFTGPAKNCVCDTLQGTTFDDFCVVESHPTGRAYGSGGDVEHIVFNGVIAKCKDNAALLRTVPDDTYKIDGVILSNASQTSSGALPPAFQQGNYHTTGDLHKNIVLNNVGPLATQLTKITKPINNMSVINCSGKVYGPIINTNGRNMNGVNIINNNVKCLQQPVGIIDINGGGSVKDVQISNCDFTTDKNNSAAALHIDSNTTVDSFLYTDNSHHNLEYGIVVEDGADITQMRLANLTWRNIEIAKYDNLGSNGSGTGKIGVTLGISRNGFGEESAGSGNVPTAEAWSIGDIVKNTDDNSIYILNSNGNWNQIS